MSFPPPMVDAPSPEFSDTRVPSTAGVGKSQNKDPNTQVRTQLLMPLSAKYIGDNTLGRISKASKEPIVEALAQTDTGISKTPAQFRVGSTEGSSIEVSEPLETETKKQPKSNNGPKVLEIPNRRSSRVSKTPARYMTGITSINITPELQKKGKTPKISPSNKTFGSKSPQASSAPPKKPTGSKEHNISTKGILTRETTVTSASNRSADKPRKHQRGEEAHKETEASPSNPPSKKMKPSSRDLHAIVSKATTSETSRKARGHKKIKLMTKSQFTEARTSPATQQRFSFEKLDTKTLHALINDAMNHYSRLPKNLTDPDSIKALYRTFFPTSTYQNYAKNLKLDVDNGGLRKMMRMIWEMTNGGEDDGMAVWEKLGVVWAKEENV